MDYLDSSYEQSLYFLNERAKELNCLYQIDELLSNQRLSLADIFKGIVKAIPSGWQFPEICHARIVYENSSYQTSGFYLSSFSESISIKVDDKDLGVLEVSYSSGSPKGVEEIFLEKERKLIRTIAERIGQTIFLRQIKQLAEEWKTSKINSSDINTPYQEWPVIIDLLGKTDLDMLLHVSKKMLNYLYFSGIKEAEEVLYELIPGWKGSFESGEVNFPSAKLPLANIANMAEKTFYIAAQTLSDGEISIRLKKWIQEKKAYALIRTVDRIDAKLSEIIDALMRYKSIATNNNMLYYPTERWLGVALIRRFLSDNLDFISIAKQYIGIDEFYDIVNHLIFTPASQGKIGGKSTGLLIAKHILAKESKENNLLTSIKTPTTWYITADEFSNFLHYNSLEELNEHKYKDLSEIRMDYPNLIQLMKNAKFPPDIIKSLAMALDDFGEKPIIVRSSSLLEDQTGSAFSGKYKSLFLANQGNKKERLDALMDAIIEVYASVFSPDSIKYRDQRGLLDFHEEMGIMIQEVVGINIGKYFLPLYAGVAFSNNEFRWSPRIKRNDGLIRLVMGLGTRAVDRLSDDFPVLISPGQAGLRVNIIPDEIKYYSPKKIDVLNLETKSFETLEIPSFLKEHGNRISNIHQIVSAYQGNYIAKMSSFDINFEDDDLVVTFDGLISDTTFIKKVASILKILEEKLGTPVDIEFASDGDDFYLLQCRPQSYGLISAPAAIPKDIAPKDIIFSANRYISNGDIRDISHIVYVDPEAYNQLQKLEDLKNVGTVVGLLNSLLPRKRFILMGPGRWGSRGDIKLGVQVSYADINHTLALIEIARKKSHYLPELSFGTHFFQDLVESDIRYLPLYPDNDDVYFNENFLKITKNILSELLPKYSYLHDVVKVIDIPQTSNKRVLQIAMNADLEEAIGYLSKFSGINTSAHDKEINEKKCVKQDQERFDDRFWHWRYYMAHRIAERLDPIRFAVKGLYLFGSTNNGTAGPNSDIDLLIHFSGTPQQREDLLQWLDGWSLSLAEMNYLKTGYVSDGLLDIHIITDEDIAKKSAFATKIDAVTDPALPLKLHKK